MNLFLYDIQFDPLFSQSSNYADHTIHELHQMCQHLANHHKSYQMEVMIFSNKFVHVYLCILMHRHLNILYNLSSQNISFHLRALVVCMVVNCRTQSIVFACFTCQLARLHCRLVFENFLVHVFHLSKARGFQKLITLLEAHLSQ